MTPSRDNMTPFPDYLTPSKTIWHLKDNMNPPQDHWTNLLDWVENYDDYDHSDYNDHDYDNDDNNDNDDDDDDDNDDDDDDDYDYNDHDKLLLKL